jgi:hypothetical protein
MNIEDKLLISFGFFLFSILVNITTGNNDEEKFLYYGSLASAIISAIVTLYFLYEWIMMK